MYISIVCNDIILVYPKGLFVSRTLQGDFVFSVHYAIIDFFSFGHLSGASRNNVNDIDIEIGSVITNRVNFFEVEFVILTNCKLCSTHSDLSKRDVR